MEQIIQGYAVLNGISVPIEFEFPQRAPEIYRSEFEELQRRVRSMEKHGD